MPPWVYLDWNATTPPLPEAVEAMAEAAARAWGNPSSLHGFGRVARAVVEDARAAVATLAGADARDVVLTSGGTEANNLALRSAFAGGEGLLVTSRLEHPSVVRVAEALGREGKATVRWLRVTPEGAFDPEDLRGALTGEVRALALSAVNHETGVVQPLSEVRRFVESSRVWVHVDGVQAYGKCDLTFEWATSCSFAAHKVRGPKGIGALIHRPGTRLAPLLVGGAQERGIRPGTTDPIAAAGMAVAARHACAGPARYALVTPLRDRLEQALRERGGVVNGGQVPRAPHVTNLSFTGWPGPEFVAALDLEGVAVSSGSACSAGTAEVSPVLTEMVGKERASTSIRISLGETTTESDVTFAIERFERVLSRSG